MKSHLKGVRLFIGHALTELECLRFMLKYPLNYIMAYIFSWSLWNSQSSKNVREKCYTLGYILA